jgi:transcriptional regulator with XRE-family HTH domain
MSIGDRIKARRKAVGLSVDELAERLGKNRATVYRYESNDIEKIPTTILEPLAKALDTTPAYLMGWSDDPIDHETTEENLNASLDAIEFFNGDAEKIYNFQKAVEQDHYDEQKEEVDNRVKLIARHLADIPEEDREQLIKNFEQTVDIYLSAKGIKRDNK